MNLARNYARKSCGNSFSKTVLTGVLGRYELDHMWAAQSQSHSQQREAAMIESNFHPGSLGRKRSAALYHWAIPQSAELQINLVNEPFFSGQTRRAELLCCHLVPRRWSPWSDLPKMKQTSQIKPIKMRNKLQIHVPLDSTVNLQLLILFCIDNLNMTM